MKRIFYILQSLFLGFLSLSMAWAQSEAIQLSDDSQAGKFANTILEKDLSKHLHIIAADSMEGRLTGTEGQKKAARYIAAHFKKLGLTPPVTSPEGNSYFQPFQRVSKKWDSPYVKVGDQTYDFMKKMYPLFNTNMKGEWTEEVVFVGDASQANLEKAKFEGKAVLILEDKLGEIRKKAALARKMGAKAILSIKGGTEEEFDQAVEYNAYYLKRGQKGLSGPNQSESVIFFIAPSVAEKIMGLSLKEIKTAKIGQKSSQAVTLSANTTEKIDFNSENVLGFMEGSEKKDEIIVLTAHYDHIGKKGEVINNGADDDGSGTVTILELAEAFAEAKKAGNGPKRSILFMTVAGEELGLLGSRFYTDIDPVFPLKNTVANLNIDMIGRIGGDYQKDKDPNYIYLIGSDKLSSELHEISEAVNEKYVNIKLDYKYNDENDPNRFYYRSDHYNFAKNNIPIIFYFNGTHPDYHKPSDTVEKIHFPKMEKIARLVFYTAWEVANRDSRLVVDKAKD